MSALTTGALNRFNEEDQQGLESLVAAFRTATDFSCSNTRKKRKLFS